MIDRGGPRRPPLSKGRWARSARRGLLLPVLMWLIPSVAEATAPLSKRGATRTLLPATEGRRLRRPGRYAFARGICVSQVPPPGGDQPRPHNGTAGCCTVRAPTVASRHLPRRGRQEPPGCAPGPVLKFRSVPGTRAPQLSTLHFSLFTLHSSLFSLPFSLFLPFLQSRGFGLTI